MAARAVFGWVGTDKATPWVDSPHFTSSVQPTPVPSKCRKAIAVPPAGFWGNRTADRRRTSDALMRIISDKRLPSKADRIISTDYYDSDRANLKELAFKATDQDCATCPIRPRSKKDKQNVRDGHYPDMGPLHFFATCRLMGEPLSAAAQSFVSVGSGPTCPQQLLAGLSGPVSFPTCAMGVSGPPELGPVSPYSAPFQCACLLRGDRRRRSADGCTPCNDGPAIAAIRPPCVQPRILRSPMIRPHSLFRDLIALQQETA